MRHIGLLAIGVVLVPSSGAWAQPDAAKAEQAGRLEEVVVTAERRSENLQVVPVTVTAITGAQLESTRTTNVQQLANIVPSLSVIDPTGYTMAFIRGVGSSTLGAGTFASVATYIDGIYIARTTNSMFELDSVESVQVLAGPQGALYGRNATAGAIVITTEKPKPGDDLSGNVSATFGDYSYRSFSGKLMTGLGDKFAIGIAAAKHDRDGFVKNLNPSGSLNTEDLDDRDSLSGSVVLVYQPTDRMSFTLRGAYTESSDHAGGGYEAVGLDVPGPIPGFSDNASAIFGGVAQIFGGVFGPATGAQIGAEAATNAVFSREHGTTYDNQRSGFDNGLLHGESPPGSSLYIENTLLSLNANFDFDAFTLRSITGYTDSDYHGSVQVALEAPGSATSQTLGNILGVGVPVPVDAGGSLGFSSINPSKVFLQGIHFLSSDSSRLKWIGGADYSKEDGKAVLTGDFFGTSLYSSNNDWSVESIAGFGQVSIPFASRWSATLGLRYTDEKYSIDDHFDTTSPLYLPGGVNVGSLSQKSDKWTYTARLEWQGDETLLYGGITTGFKSATLNVNSPAQGRADPEEVESYEIGFKRDFLGRYRLNASLYYAIYQGIQLNVIQQSTGANFLANGPDADVTGLDLQATAQFTDNFDLSLGLTALDPEFSDNTPDLQIKGNRLPGAAKLATSLIGNFRFPLASAGSLNLTAAYVHNSGMYYDHLNLVGSGGATDDSYDIVNLNLTYRSPGEHWEASLWGNNVFDEDYYRTGIIAFGTFGRDAIAGNPANFGVTVKVMF
jgi:iron complex outermembrane recepter protein